LPGNTKHAGKSVKYVLDSLHIRSPHLNNPFVSSFTDFR